MTTSISSATDVTLLANQMLTSKANTDIESKLGKSASRERIREVAEDFEAVFLTEMMGHMFKGIKPNERFGGGNGENVFNSLLIQEYGKSIAQSGGIGLADNIER